MSFDIEQTLKDMTKAIGTVLTGELPKVQDCINQVLKDEKDALKDIADARLRGEINDDELKSQLDDEKKTLVAALLVCEIKAKLMVQKAVNAAVKVFTDAIELALKTL